MNDLLLLLKYRFRNTGFSKNRGKRSGKLWGIWFNFIILIMAFGVPLFPVALTTFEKLSAFSVASGFNMADVYFSVLYLVMLTMAAMNFIPYLLYSFYDWEELHFLMGLPIRRSTILFYKCTEAFIGTFMSFAIYLPIAAAYGYSRRTAGLVLAIPAAFLGFAFVLGISLFISALLTSRISRAMAKRMNGIVILLNAGVFLLLLNLLSGEALNGETLYKMINLGLNRFLPSTWLMKATKGGLLEWVLLFLFTLWLFRIATRISSANFYEPSHSKVNSQRAAKARKIGLLKKEWLIMMRSEHAAFFLLYPVAFSAIMLVTTKNFLSATLFMVMIAAFYSSQMVIISLSSEFQAWPLPFILPVNFKKVVRSKIFIVSGMFSVLYSIIVIFSIFYIQLSILLLFTIVAAMTTFYISSALGATLYMTSGAYRSGAHKRRLGFSATLLLEILTFVTGAGNIIVLALYMQSRTDAMMKETLLRFLKSELLLNTLGVSIPLVVSVIGIIWVTRCINKELDKLKEGK